MQLNGAKLMDITNGRTKMEREQNRELMKYTYELSRRNSKAWEMMVTANRHFDEWSNSRISRWIGYAQCLLVAEGAITLDKLKDDAREILKGVEDGHTTD
jgi:hypothetical protein